MDNPHDRVPVCIRELGTHAELCLPWGENMREISHRSQGRHIATGTWVVGLVSFAVLAWSGWRGTAFAWPPASDQSLAVMEGLVSGVFVAGAVVAAFVSWRRHARQRGVDRSADERQVEIDFALLATTRDQRERLHELRSTVAGLVQGSALLDNASLTDEARQHLWGSVRRELERMQRLLVSDHGTTTNIDLDDALRVILDLQRLKGRHVELHTSGDTVRARYDSLAEVVNILMDNAVTHGGSDNSVVEVARRDDETVDITVTDFGRGIPSEEREHIFEWGRRRADSPGEGIGLHVAKRLVTEDGGSLRLAEAQGAGSTFVISLPAVRRSSENYLTDEEAHVASRRSR